MLTTPIGARQALCTHGYRIRILIEFEVPISSGEGYHALADERENIWARSVLNMRQEVSTVRRGQLAPSSWSWYLQDFRILDDFPQVIPFPLVYFSFFMMYRLNFIINESYFVSSNLNSNWQIRLELIIVHYVCVV